jgi:hypothetical protein
LKREAEELNAGFMMRMRKGRPFVRLKSAASLDGRTALANGRSQWITSEESRVDVQHWRAQSGAILTSAATVIADDPRLDVRIDTSWVGKRPGAARNTTRRTKSPAIRASNACGSCADISITRVSSRDLRNSRSTMCWSKPVRDLRARG